MMYGQPIRQPRNPGTWLGLSIAATMMCCWPLAIPGIVFAAKALQAQGQGDVARWERQVNRSRAWTLWSIWLTITFVAVVIAAGVVNYLSQL